METPPTAPAVKPKASKALWIALNAYNRSKSESDASVADLAPEVHSRLEAFTRGVFEEILVRLEKKSIEQQFGPLYLVMPGVEIAKLVREMIGE